MRKTKALEIAEFGKSIVVNELKLGEIVSLLEGSVLKDATLKSFRETFEETLIPLCTNLDPNDLLDLAPSELLIIWTAFKDVNSVFFEMARKASATFRPELEKIRKILADDFIKLLAALSKPDTGTS